MAKILVDIDKIRTTTGTEVDLENIQASGGAAGLEGSGIAYSTDGTDEFYDAGNSSEIIALNVNNPQDGEGLIYDSASQTWKNADIAQKVQATGGDIVNTYTDAAGLNWKYHIFEQSGNFVVMKGGSVEFLIIGGGGCGSGHAGGGGGAGGLISSISGYKSGMDSSPVSTMNVSPQSYQIFVGAGATGHARGGDSTAFGLTAVGGGWGAGHYNSGGGNTWVASGDGGSGGGGHLIYSGHDGMGGSGTHNQGFDGGNSPWANSANHACSGGGGSGEAGGSPANVNDAGGKGGDGTLINCTGTDYYWAAGGGGGIHYNTPAGAGGRGGGGGGSGFWSGAGQPAGADGYKAGTAGISGAGGGNGAGGQGGENTGSGGGADGIANSAAGGQGGSGIVIIRYLA